MLDFLSTLSPGSVLPYALWRLRGRRSPVRLRMKTGPLIEMRPSGLGAGGNNDFGVAYEIFVHDLYGQDIGLAPGDVRRVVDLGANVGYSVLVWLARFPACTVLAFEPHPGHAEQAMRNVELNGQAHRVELRRVGAGAIRRDAGLTDRGSGSTVAEGGEIGIAIVDVLPDLTAAPIDLLKMDIEGAEYEIMADPRFEQVRARAILMEWHQRGAQGLDWCQDRLRALGYRITHATDDGGNGMITAIREDQ